MQRPGLQGSNTRFRVGSSSQGPTFRSVQQPRMHSQKPQAMLARGTRSPILGEVEVGVIVQLHLKRRNKNVTNPITNAQKANTEICIK
jgi:hypothetical protein